MNDELRVLWEAWDPLRVYRYDGWPSGEYDSYLAGSIEQFARTPDRAIRADLVELHLLRVLTSRFEETPEAIECLSPREFAKVLSAWYEDRAAPRQNQLPMRHLVARINAFKKPVQQH